MKQEKKNSVSDRILSGLRKLSYLLYIIGLLFISLLLVGILFIRLFQTLDVGLDPMVAGALASQLSLGFYAIALFGFKKDLIMNEFNSFSFKTFWYGVRLTVLVLVINLIVSSLLVQTESMPEQTQNIIENNSILMTFILPVIAAPLFEELSFRAGLKYVLIDKGGWGKISYVLVSSVIFGLLHWTPGAETALAHVVLTGLMGILYSIVYLKTKNIYIIIISHMLYNGLVITAASLV